MPTRATVSGMLHAPGHPWFRLLEPGLIEFALPPTTTDDEVSAAFVELERWMFSDVAAPYGFVVRLEGLFSLTSRQRRIATDAEVRYRSVERRFNAGQAIVLTSPMQRGIFTAFTWVTPPVWPYQIFATFDEALAWLRAHFAEVTSDHPDGPRWRGRLSDRRRPAAGVDRA
jgi:hypothetical protein